MLNRARPADFYWITGCAAQLTLLAEAKINGSPKNVDAELKGSATPEDIVRIVVRT